MSRKYNKGEWSELYAFARLLVFVWRKYAADFIRNSKIFKVINKLPLISKIASMAGER